MNRIRTIIMGAAGRDFHNFNTFYRDNDQYEVVAFTATQIPNIEGRKYPAELAGKLYPNGIDIYPEDELPKLIKDFKVDEVVFAYSDVPHTYVMHKASQVNALGADFFVMGTKRTQVKSTSRRGCLRRAHWLWQEPNHAQSCPNTHGNGLQSCCNPPPYAVWRFGQTKSAALRDICGPG